MPSMMGGNTNWKLLSERRAIYAQKLLAKGVIKNSSKWRTLMHRKGL